MELKEIMKEEMRREISRASQLGIQRTYMTGKNNPMNNESIRKKQRLRMIQNPR